MQRLQTQEELQAEAKEIQDTIIEYISLIKHRLEPKPMSPGPTHTLDVTGSHRATSTKRAGQLVKFGLLDTS